MSEFEETVPSAEEGNYTSLYILAILSVLIAAMGVISNILSLTYFVTRLSARDNSTTRLFMMLNIFDLLLCVYSTIMIIIWVQILKMEMPVTFKFFCIIYQVVLANLTSFFTCLIAVTRMVDLIWPLSVVEKRQRATNIAIVLYSFCNVCLAIFQMIYISSKDMSNTSHVIVLWTIASMMTSLFVIVIFSNVLCILKLYKSNLQTITTTRHATITVGILSVIYCVCNVGFIADRVKYAFNTHLDETLLSVVFHSILLPLNSACNPVVYFARKAEMRLYLKNIWRKARGVQESE